MRTIEFSREGEHSIRCVITEEEIEELGYTVDEILTNSERTQEFMNEIFDLAEQEFDTKFDLGVKTVRADFLPDHTLALTFSEHPTSGGMMEHLKDIVNGLLNSIPQDKWNEIKKNVEEKAKEEPEEYEPNVIVQFAFSDMNTLCKFAKRVNINPIPENALYRYENQLYLIMDVSYCSEQEVYRLSALTDEYANGVQVGSEKRAFLQEHGKQILKERAIEQLREI